MRRPPLTSPSSNLIIDFSYLTQALIFSEDSNSQVNHDARKERHGKLFGQTKSKVARYKQVRARMKRHAKNAQNRFASPLHGLSPAQQIFNRVFTATLVLFLVNSVNLSSAAYDDFGYYDAQSHLAIESNKTIIADNEGYLIKSMPLEGEARYLNRGKDTVLHEVQPGDTLSVIAYRYDLKMDTIQWANSSLGNGDYLKVGQELEIPPENGVEIKVKKGDTWDKLITRYKTEQTQEDLVAWNESDALIEGETVFVLGGRMPAPVYTAANNRGSRGGYSAVPPRAPALQPVEGGWVKPSVCSVTQWYRWGHYAIDCANTSKPAIVAARAGTVTRAEYSGWNGGYGNVIVIDHGDGYKSLYAHNEDVYVTVGQRVGQGEVIAKMGATGRVYGRTGIHLHFELISGGTKINPGFMF